MTASKKIIVFVDTSYLSRMPYTQPDWQRLLKLCQEGKIEIHISHITAEEYRTQHKDYLIAKIEETKVQWDALKKEWDTNPLSEFLPNLPPLSFLNTEEIEEKSKELLKKLRDTYKVKILEPGSHHGMNVWGNYFAWKLPFNLPSQLSELANSKTREKRRKDIPDAWIYEAALDLLGMQHKILCLCKDGDLTKSLKSKTQDVFSDAADVLRIIEPAPPAPTPAPMPAPSPTPNNVAQEATTNTEPHATDVEEVIKKIHEQEKRLQVRILGYVHWFSPVSKSDLIHLLQEKGYTASAIGNLAQQLALNGLIRDTGNNYIPLNEALCEQAANSIMSELLAILDK